MNTKPVAMVFGASRGIGKSIAVTLSRRYHIIVLSKSSGSSKLPGTIEEVLADIIAIGNTGECIKCDVRSSESISNAVNHTFKKYGRIDAVICNAGAIYWADVKDTTLDRYDLMHSVNDRGLYAVIQSVLPIYNAQKTGKFVVVSPPIYSRFFRGKTAYAMTKVAMSVLAMGLAMDFKKSQSIRY